MISVSECQRLSEDGFEFQAWTVSLRLFVPNNSLPAHHGYSHRTSLPPPLFDSDFNLSTLKLIKIDFNICAYLDSIAFRVQKLLLLPLDSLSNRDTLHLLQHSDPEFYQCQNDSDALNLIKHLTGKNWPRLRYVEVQHPVTTNPISSSSLLPLQIFTLDSLQIHGHIFVAPDLQS